MLRKIGCATAILAAALSGALAAEVQFDGQIQITSVDPSCSDIAFAPVAGQSGFISHLPAGGENGTDSRISIFLPRPSGAPPFVAAHLLLPDGLFDGTFRKVEGTAICTSSVRFKPLVRVFKVHEHAKSTDFEFDFKRFFGIATCRIKGQGVVRQQVQVE